MLRSNFDVLGPDRIIFAVDDPFTSTLGPQGKESRAPGFCRAFIESAPISDEDKSKLAHLNAERLLLPTARNALPKLGHPPNAASHTPPA
jgi:predicted TIM-barrel fold metal-dependent hydrolase